MGAVQPNLRIIAEKLDAFPLFLKPYKIEIHLRSVVSLLPIHRTTLKSGEIVLTFPCRFRRIYRIAPMLVRNSAIHCTSAVGIWEFDSSEFVSSVSARFVPGPLGLDWQIQTERRAITEAISSMNALDDELARQRRQAIEYFLLLIFHRRPRDEHDELRTLVNEHIEHPTEKEEAKSVAQTMAQHLRESGREEVAAQAAQAMQKTVLGVLRWRFDAVPETVIHRITLIRDLSRLGSLHDKALNAETLEEIDSEIDDRE